ncbi:GntR family transcriptional regulator [Dactylosporangium aurantiacum]|uniref:GntR family transcriptional regulator n=1 Tax=Dactylosporangium aurantiacum TaxID=35754 RepID=A0A9Q9IJ07_9ACTN|nr:GntR family transcriptional regulator [Dactylosporangium aurantiacum]MDG6109644.1 GntR family transcriptional regulator [Dactylosporangium aurantiacum]UWZ54259.1 GntR family transcriptional regulator [Dactylosporangium aurantiacum]
MPIEYRPPKYITIVNALQARIEDGTYASGEMLPSETALMAEFDTSRPTVVRSLEILRQDGWIDTQQGKGRFVRSKPPEPRKMPAHAASLLADEAVGRVRILDVAEVPAPARASSALDIDAGSPIVVRRRLVSVDGLGPVELGTVYVPVGLAAGTDVGSTAPLPEGLLRHLSVRKGVQFTHVTERISARPATPDERELLEVDDGSWLLTALFAVYTRDGLPAFALDVAVPPARHEFEDSFPIT